MLKTKNIFITFFVLLILCFGVIFYTLTNSYLNFLLLKQYEQKIKSLDDVLKFSLLEDLNSNNIKEFAQDTRADFIILKDDFEISSVLNADLFLNLEENKIYDLNSKRVLVKKFTYKDYKYMIIVYPRFLNLQNFWLKISISFGIYFMLVFILVFFMGRKLAKSFKKILEFLNFINDSK
ncbi:sensor histidine kinase, partial [Campylobacter coli]|nr:sensor histidine kinase [Campylobacter coli]EAJ2647907.1 sensor histidine kinase [Campylobacter coli]EAJ4473586.1 sensor histidine kinase [Campylobacter coli]EAL3153227.1 sensor histidine kinase [Campylobacter coli]EAL3219255.1 sensor histidine kinase [Campylobacter coli]